MVDPDRPDEVLMADVGGGDEEAFNALVERYERPLLNFIYRFVGDYQLARDVYQETFLRVYRAARSYDPARKFSTWLFQIAANLSIDELRRCKVTRLLEMNLRADRAPEGLAALTDAYPALLHDWQSAAAEDSAQMMEHKGQTERVQAAIQALPADGYRHGQRLLRPQPGPRDL